MSVARLAFALGRSRILYCWAFSLIRCLQEGSNGYVGADVSADALTPNHCFALYAMQWSALYSARIDPCRARVI